MTAVGPVLAVRPGARHALHDPARSWPETNCSVDLWIELLAAWGHEPLAAMGFTAALDFEGDQFTFFKIPPGDIERLYGLRLNELSLYDRLEDHVAEQIGRGCVPLIEMDAWYLPDTAGVSYRSEHTKTTVGINVIDEPARRIGYFHNAGYFEVSGEDYDGLFQRLPGQRTEATLFPYAEVVKRTGPGLAERQLVPAALELLRGHVAARPSRNPVAAWAEAFPAHAERLAGRPEAFFHKYAFNTLRQLGSAFELLASHLDWLGAGGVDGLEPAGEAARRIAEGAKTSQFHLARATARRRFDTFQAGLAPLAADWTTVLDTLAARLDAAGAPARAA